MIDVVTAVLKNGDKILILKRGDKVRTYKGKWACVSGYLEENEEALERAYIEIEEETGLKRDDVKLIKAGEPIEFYDEKEKMSWRVHPFLFEAKRGDVKIDWEHTEYKWIYPEEIVKYETVPKLKDVIFNLLEINE
ncbi:MAG: NUDIX pyrophosphatase [Thermoplasmata archaeon]|nr:NUDIX pyrophosphatase [Thermoplasmata archaeon]